jgi:hypothetical protein
MAITLPGLTPASSIAPANARWRPRSVALSQSPQDPISVAVVEAQASASTDADGPPIADTCS